MESIMTQAVATPELRTREDGKKEKPLSGNTPVTCKLCNWKGKAKKLEHHVSFHHSETSPS